METKTRNALEIALACPICRGALAPIPDQVTCEKCRHPFPVEGGIPQLFWQNDWRRWMFRVSGDRMQFLDPQIRDRAANQGRKQAWFLDQYKNPHESKHTTGEVQGWFKENGFEFLNSIPKAQGENFAADEKLFEPHAPGTALNHFLVQAGETLVGGRDGGFFIMIGKRL